MSERTVCDQLLEQPHHDTGPAFLRGERCAGGELTAVLWVPAALEPQQVILRQVVDGEPAVSVMRRTASTPHGSWWQGAVRLTNPVVHYRFLLVSDTGPAPYLWYSADGLWDHDVPDAGDFRLLAADEAPGWVSDAVVYQIFPDRFGQHIPPAERQAPEWAERRDWLDEPPVAGPPTGRAWYGGDLDGIADHLDYLEDLGVNAVYLTPVFPAASTHRYDSTTFSTVDPLLGGDPALVRLSQALHERGMRLVLDLTTNHTGLTHEWFQRATADPQSAERSFYVFDDYPAGYRCWLDVPSLPQLDHRSEALADRLLRGPDSVVGRWIGEPWNIDGWRIDVANMTGRQGMVDLAHRVARDIRSTMRERTARTGRELWLVAEHGHDASGDLTGPGWHGAMNYMGFTRPLWTWLSQPDPADGLTWLGIPTGVPHLSARAVVAGMRRYWAQLSHTAQRCAMNLLDSHDTPRIRTVVGGSRALHHVAAVALFTLPGAPTVFSGDELGATGRTGEHSRTTIPWRTRSDGTQESMELERRGSWGEVDEQTHDVYRRLARLRRDLPALRHGGLRFVHAHQDVMAWERTHPQGHVLVVLARGASESMEFDLSDLHSVSVGRECFVEGLSAHCQGQVLRLQVPGPGALIITLEASEEHMIHRAGATVWATTDCPTGVKEEP